MLDLSLMMGNQQEKMVMDELNIGHEEAKKLIEKYGSVRKAIDSYK
ncbi:hypothetical protein N9K77_00505 [bacterium]|nr:hypothetical protein [bacterium]